MNDCLQKTNRFVVRNSNFKSRYSKQKSSVPNSANSKHSEHYRKTSSVEANNDISSNELMEKLGVLGMGDETNQTEVNCDESSNHYATEVMNIIKTLNSEFGLDVKFEYTDIDWTLFSDDDICAALEYVKYNAGTFKRIFRYYAASTVVGSSSHMCMVLKC